jgi:hypothetical protein
VDEEPALADLDLGAVSTPGELVALLRVVHVRADGPSLRTLEDLTRHQSTRLSRTVVSEMLRGDRFPTKAVMLAFLRACGVADGNTEPWRRAWERVAPIAIRHAQRQNSGGRSSANESALDNADAASWPEIEQTEAAAATLAAQHGGTAHGRPSGLTRSQSMWHFPDGAAITLVAYRLADPFRPQFADPNDPNYTRYAGLADLDALIDIYGMVKAYNPDSPITIEAAQDLGPKEIATHVVLVGGLAWQAVTRWFHRIFPIPIDPGDTYDRGAIVVHETGNVEREFRHSFDENGELLEDVGYFARGPNPKAPRRTLTVCGGVTSRGVRGAAQCFIDREMREHNEAYVAARFPDKSVYCIVMRVAVVNKDPLTPDLRGDETILFEWSSQ